MKKLIIILLSLLLILSLCSCGGSPKEEAPVIETEVEEEIVPEVTPEPDPPQEEEPEPVPEPETYTTLNNLFTFDIPYGLEMTAIGKDDGDYVEVSSPEGWTLYLYEHIANYVGSVNSYNDSMDNVSDDVELLPITIAGNENVYWQEEYPGIFLFIVFADPATNDRSSDRWGSIWLFTDPIDGFETADYLEIPEVKAIIESIRVPE